MSHTGGCLTRSDCRSSTGGGSSGRPSARLVAAAPQQWRSFEAVAELFDGPQDTEWETDRDRIDQAVRDPWTVRAILDTSVVIATDVGPLQRELAIKFGHAGRTALRRARGHGRRRARRTAAPASILQHHFDALPVEEAVAASYGRLATAVVAAGRQPRARTMDLLIAATVHAHSARVYTRNAKDFVGADSLVEIVAV